MYHFKILTTCAEMLNYCDLVNQLGYNYDKQEYERLFTEMIPKGYSQLAVMNENEECVAIAGYWISAKLHSGKYVELDNVVVDEQHRSTGVGQLLSDKVEEIAKEQGCKLAMLNAYVQNSGAHKFYFSQRYKILGYHFHKKLG